MIHTSINKSKFFELLNINLWLQLRAFLMSSWNITVYMVNKFAKEFKLFFLQPQIDIPLIFETVIL